MNVYRQFESWVVSSYAQPVGDLAIFRVIYAAYVIGVYIPSLFWIRNADDVFFFPPLGLAAVFTAAPPLIALYGLCGCLGMAAFSLMFGFKTRLAGLSLVFLMYCLNSWAFAYSKINHDILQLVVPLVLSFTNWGQAFSVNAKLHPVERSDSRVAVPMFFLAYLFGVAFVTSGGAKILSGWMDFNQLCTYGHLWANYRFVGRETFLGEFALAYMPFWLWKLSDWIVVVLEILLLIAIVQRRFFNVVLASLAVFHLGVLLLFDIPFYFNIIAYGAFLNWSSLFPFNRYHGGVSSLRIPGVFALLALVCLAGSSVSPSFLRLVQDSIVFGGAGFAGAYLLRELMSSVLRFTRRSKVKVNLVGGAEPKL